MLNLSHTLEDSARRFAQKTAIIFGDTHLTFRQLDNQANQVANGLVALGIKKGDKIALSCPNVPHFPILYFGILKAGAVVVPLSILLKRSEVTYHLKDSDARMYFCFEGSEALPMRKEGFAGFQGVDSCEHFVVITGKSGVPSPIPGVKTYSQFIDGQPEHFISDATSAEDTAVIIYTSGTTGKPKGAELTHSNLAWNADLCRHLFQFKDDDVTLTVLPMFHIFGQTCLMNASIMHGVTNVLLFRFDAGAVLRLMETEHVSIFAGVPTMYWGLLNYEDELGIRDIDKITDRLRLCISGGASLPVKVLEEFEKKYNVAIYEGYGMSEGSPVVTFNPPGEKRKPGSIGIPVWGVEVMLADENDNPVAVGEKGQLLYRGHNVMKGYYDRPEVNQEALKGGWMHSGDVAIQDKEGYYYIVDRTKDMIIRGGLNVYPREVEEIIMQHEAVSLVAVIGTPHERLGEEVKACIVLKDGAKITEHDLMEWVKKRIAAYKYPRLIEYMDNLPMSATGKILKRELRAKVKLQ